MAIIVIGELHELHDVRKHRAIFGSALQFFSVEVPVVKRVVKSSTLVVFKFRCLNLRPPCGAHTMRDKKRCSFEHGRLPARKLPWSGRVLLQAAPYTLACVSMPVASLIEVGAYFLSL